MAKIVLDPITSGYNLSKINANFVALAAELQEKVLYRDNPSGEPNLMNNDLDMNAKRILNLPTPVAATEVARLKDVQTMGATSLPEQTGHAGKFIQTDGEVASWQVPYASEISNTPAGEVEATTVQGAINEIDTDLQGFKTTIASNVAEGYVAKSGETGSAVVPTGTQAQRDATPSAGYFRFNSDTGKFEGYDTSDWKAFVQLEDVDGSPGLPAVDGSKLTGVTTGSNVSIATITPAADADVTLTSAQYTADVLVIETGAWTEARNIIVPDESRSWQVISNSAHAATVTTAAGTGEIVPAKQSRQVLCNGTDVVSIRSDVGTVVYHAANAPLSGYLKANGSAVSRTTYASLFSVIGTTFGVGDGSTTFNLPDLRGEFLRGWDDGRGVDSGRALGSAQGGQVQSHVHDNRVGFTGSGAGSNRLLFDSKPNDGGIATEAFGGGETRPRNIALLAYIKY